MNRARHLTATLSATAVILVACGSDAEPLTKEQFIEQADAICQHTSDVIEPIMTRFWSDFEGEEDATVDDAVFVRFDELFGEVTPHFEQQLSDLRDLEPPEGDRDAVSVLLNSFEGGIDTINEVIDDAVGGDDAARERLGSDDDPFDEANQLAREYGLSVCGESS
jgi:hypothetical protein